MRDRVATGFTEIYCWKATVGVREQEAMRRSWDAISGWHLELSTLCWTGGVNYSWVWSTTVHLEVSCTVVLGSSARPRHRSEHWEQLTSLYPDNNGSPTNQMKMPHRRYRSWSLVFWSFIRKPHSNASLSLLVMLVVMLYVVMIVVVVMIIVVVMMMMIVMNVSFIRRPHSHASVSLSPGQRFASIHAKTVATMTIMIDDRDNI